MVRAGTFLLMTLLLGVSQSLYGFSDEKLASHRRMISELARIEAETPETNRYLGLDFLKVQRAIYDALPPEASTKKKFEALIWLGIAELNHGREREAIAHLERAIAPPHSRPDRRPR